MRAFTHAALARLHPESTALKQHTVHAQMKPCPGSYARAQTCVPCSLICHTDVGAADVLARGTEIAQNFSGPLTGCLPPGACANATHSSGLHPRGRAQHMRWPGRSERQVWASV